MTDPVRVAIGPVSQPIAKISEETIHTTNEGKTPLLLEQLDQRQGRILVFTRTKSRTDRLVAGSVSADIWFS